MAKTDWNEQLRQEVDAIRGEKAHDQVSACQASDLKGLLHSIVDQLSEADRRHSDTLRQMQDKLANLGREAQSLRARVPSQFSAAFERVEAGMSELAARVAEVSDGGVENHAAVTPSYGDIPSSAPTPAQSWPQTKPAEPPMALRSVTDPTAQAARRREEEANRAQGGIDTFDVIESLPGNVANPWDHDAADALAGIYDSGEASFIPLNAAHETAANQTATFAPVVAAAASAPQSAGAHSAMSGTDRSWLEARFSEISSHIDAQIKDIHHDQSFFALGQRLDQFERQFNSALEGVATHGDVEGIRLIEAHMTELSNHLESAHLQLTRLEVIEDQLAGIASKLADVRHAATVDDSRAAVVADGAEAPAAIDVHAVAKAAVHEAAAHFAEIQPRVQPGQGLDEVRGMLQRLMSDNRQGEENTNALLDTLQQAMIRLLDRVDAMELAQHQHALGRTVPQDYLREQPRFESDTRRSSTNDGGETLDAAVAAVATSRTISPFAQSANDEPGADNFAANRPAHFNEAASQTREAAQAPERIRQDFIADARRAKMRLAAENTGQSPAAEIVIKKPEATDKPAASKAASAAAGKAAAAKDKDKAKSATAMSPRVMVVAIAALLAGGLYLVNPFATDTPVSTLKPLPAPGANKAAKSGDAASSKEANSASPTAQGSDGKSPVTEGSGAATPAETQPEGAKKDGETRGEIVSPEAGDVALESTTVPLMGVTVDSERTMSTDEMQRAKRQHAMATMSGKLGQAAAQNPTQQATPAALMPSFDGLSASPQGGRNGVTTSSPLDLPPASVGPLSLRLAAANGDPSAEFEVGARLAEGKGTDQNFKEAAKWYQRSASRGFVQSQYRLGTLYERGLGVKPDPARAQDWYKRAAEQGNVKAMHNLAVLSANQNKTAPDYPAAAKWFTDAAERGLSDSQFNLAVLHENGLGVPQDLKQAYKWLSLSARAGDKEAVRRRDILKGKLTVEDLNQAEALIAGFRTKSTDPMANDARTAGEAWKKNTANGANG